MKALSKTILVFILVVNTSLSTVYAHKDGASNPGAIKSPFLASVSKSVSSELLQTLWSNGASLTDVANRLLQDTLLDEESEFVVAIKKLYQDNAESYAQPIFPKAFAHIDLKNAVMLNEGNDSMGFDRRHAFPLHGAVASKTSALIGWLIVDIGGPIQGPVRVQISLAQGIGQLSY